MGGKARRLAPLGLRIRGDLAAGKATARLSGCRVVTTSMAARLLIAGQLRALTEFDWSLVSGDAYPDAPADLAVHLVPMRREPAPADLASFGRLTWLLCRHRFAFVQTHTPKASLLALPAARLSRTRTIYTVHGSLFFRDNSRIGNIGGWVFERWCCSWANRVVVQSEEDLDVLPKAHICPRRKLSYIGNGIALDRFTVPVEPALSADRPIVIMVSRLVAEKGCRDFFAVARELGDRAEFVHVGPTEHDQRDAIGPRERARAADHVRFIGAVEDVRPYVAAADLLVLPSYREGIPRAAMEAAAMGKAVVAYDVRGVREVIPPSTGLLVARGDVAALADLVRSLLDEPERRESLARVSRDRVRSTYSEELVVKRLRAVYADVVRR